MPDGSEHEFTTYGKNDSQDVAVIAITRDNKVIIARQFRAGPERVMDELPGGRADDGEELQEAALRELAEETGYRSSNVEYLGFAYRDAYKNSTSNYFIAYDCVKTSDQKLEQGEFVEVITITVKRLRDNARNGNMTDAVAVLMADKHLNSLTKSE